jgi:hypothetical protein
MILYPMLNPILFAPDILYPMLHTLYMDLMWHKKIYRAGDTSGYNLTQKILGAFETDKGDGMMATFFLLSRLFPDFS